jgi:hypothetical protein
MGHPIEQTCTITKIIDKKCTSVEKKRTDFNIIAAIRHFARSIIHTQTQDYNTVHTTRHTKIQNKVSV